MKVTITIETDQVKHTNGLTNKTNNEYLPSDTIKKEYEKMVLELKELLEEESNENRRAD